MRSVADLSPAVRQQLAVYSVDTLYEKHEGMPWDIQLHYSSFFEFDGYTILLPVPEKHRPQITLYWLSAGKDGQVVTLYLEDTTYWTEKDEADPEMQFLKPRYTNFLAICEKVPGQDFYITVLYHHGIISRYPGTGRD